MFLSEEVMQEFYPPQVPQPGALRIDALSPPEELPAPFPAGDSVRLPHADSSGPRAP
jgi:hypothetical protein